MGYRPSSGRLRPPIWPTGTRVRRVSDPGTFVKHLSYSDIARLLGTGLISTGLALIVFVIVTITWGDPISALSEQGAQGSLKKEFAVLDPGSAQLGTSKRVDPRLTK